MAQVADALAPFLRAKDTAAAAIATASARDEQGERVLRGIDAFFSKATAFQTRRTELAEQDAKAFQADTRAVFLFYMRVAAVLTQRDASDESDDSAESLLGEVMHVTRVVPFCQVFAHKNPDSVRQLLAALVEAVSAFQDSLAAVREVYCKRYDQLHAAVESAKRADVVDLVHGVYEMSLSLLGILSPSTTEPLLLNGKNAEADLDARASSVIYALARCYELDLPHLQRQLATFSEKAQQKMVLIAETRRTMLQILDVYLSFVMEQAAQGDVTEKETLLAVLHALAHSSDKAEADGGSFLSDLWFLCGLKDRVAEYFTTHEMDHEQFSYLDMVVDGLPKRRIVAAVDTQAAARKPRPSAEAKAKASEVDIQEEKRSATSQVVNSGDDEAVLASLVAQVKDFFPDLGEGYIELCLLTSKRQPDVVINFLLESNPPPELIELPQALSKSDGEYARVRARITGAPAPASKKLDPSQVWVGKKPIEKEYDPQIGKKDQQLAEKMKQIVAHYEDEDDLLSGGIPPGSTLDEYDDDYNDEFEDYEPFGVHDGGHDDQDAIRELNRRMRAKEEEEAFWESMKNPNHRPIADENDEGSAQETNSDAQGKKTTAEPLPTGRKFQDRKKGERPGPSDNDKQKEPPTAQQVQRTRARKDKNKAKVANHHRKERALKKMG